MTIILHTLIDQHQLPFASADSETPDLEVVRRAWWEAIIKTYEYIDTCPMRMPLEMRIMGDSNVLMAPQRGNKAGTCSIEILTLESMKDKWHDFAQKVLNAWMELRYRDRSNKEPLNIRPHWAKEWYDYYIS